MATSLQSADQNTAVSQCGTLNRHVEGPLFETKAKQQNVAEKVKGFCFHLDVLSIRVKEDSFSKTSSIPLKTECETFVRPPQLKSLFWEPSRKKKAFNPLIKKKGGLLCEEEFAKRYLLPVFCPQLSLLPKANVGAIPCASEGGLDAQDSAKWQRLFAALGGIKKKKRRRKKARLVLH